MCAAAVQADMLREMLEQIMDDEDELREINLSSRPRREERRKQRERERMERQLTRYGLGDIVYLLDASGCNCRCCAFFRETGAVARGGWKRGGGQMSQQPWNPCYWNRYCFCYICEGWHGYEPPLICCCNVQGS
jgi:hypothetical protein